VLVSPQDGYADVTEGRPVDPAETLFPGGSLAKPITWLALMQLVEADEVALDAPVSHYLPEAIELPIEFDEPIIVAHLMTHAAGLGDRVPGIFTRDPEAVPSLEAYFE
jgi:CubicO group peptidase (beta-lactamase class C family)